MIENIGFHWLEISAAAFPEHHADRSIFQPERPADLIYQVTLVRRLVRNNQTWELLKMMKILSEISPSAWLED
jgi:hypothetical protein